MKRIKSAVSTCVHVAGGFTLGVLEGVFEVLEDWVWWS